MGIQSAECGKWEILTSSTFKFASFHGTGYGPPLSKLSTATTDAPLDIKSSQTCDPMNPTAPVTRYEPSVSIENGWISISFFAAEGRGGWRFATRGTACQRVVALLREHTRAPSLGARAWTTAATDRTRRRDRWSCEQRRRGKRNTRVPTQSRPRKFIDKHCVSTSQRTKNTTEPRD
jgi:hypothetical protein